MSKKTLILVAAALILGAVYVIKFTDWFAEKNIQIIYRNRGPQTLFGFTDKEYSLTTIKVVKVDEANTNKYAVPLWHLVASNPKSGSEKIGSFEYGQKINGMKPAIPETSAEPLSRNTKYRIYVEAGKLKGERIFETE